MTAAADLDSLCFEQVPGRDPFGDDDERGGEGYLLIPMRRSMAS